MKKLFPAALALLLAATSTLATFAAPVRSAAQALVPAACSERLTNGGFESGTTGWQVKTNGPGPVVGSASPHTGASSAILGGRNNAQDELEQETSLPAGQSATLRFWWRMITQQTTHAFDTLEVSFKPDGGQETILTTITDGSAAGSWQQSVFDLSAYAGQTVRIKLTARTNDTLPTTFYVDDISLQACSGATDTPTVTATVTTPTATTTVGTPTATTTVGTPTATATVGTPAGSVTPDPSSTPHAKYSITFPGGNFSYTPSQLSLAVGDEVEWSGPFAFHPLVSEDNLWPVVSSGDSFRFVFTQPGVYRYYCQLHGGPGGAGMSGVIRVGLQRRVYLPVLMR